MQVKDLIAWLSKLDPDAPLLLEGHSSLVVKKKSVELPRDPIPKGE